MFLFIRRFLPKSITKSTKNYARTLTQYKKFNENHDREQRSHSEKWFKVGVLLAASVPIINKSDEKQDNKVISRRDRYNFIADVAEISFPSIVQVEVLAMGPFHSVLVSGGSGFIVSEDGFILTNAHVIRDRNSVTIKLNDGRKFNGKVVKVDQMRDIAAVKINCNDLHPLEFESPDRIRVGEFVIALGSPLALSNSVTSGIISSTSREALELGLRNNMEYIQTDALITLGNSGGPLINLDGKVVGMNTMKADAGIGFAVPSKDLAKFANDLLGNRDRYVSGELDGRKRHYLGIKMFTINESTIDALFPRGSIIPPSSSGCYVVMVAPNSPAERAGLQRGDIIIRINDTNILDSTDVFRILEQTPTLNVTVLRNGLEINLYVIADEIKA